MSVTEKKCVCEKERECERVCVCIRESERESLYITNTSVVFRPYERLISRKVAIQAVYPIT